MASQLRPVTVALCALAVSLSVPSPAMARQTGCQLSTTTAGLTACFAVLALTTTTLTSNQTNGIGDTNSGAAGAAGNDAGFFEGILFGATNGGAGGVAPSVELLVQFQSFSITTNGILSSPRTAITVRSLGGDGGRGGDDFGIFSGLGGDGGRGGNGSTVSLTTTSTGGVIQTGPSFTFLFLPFFGGHGIYALSRGGDGGDGGDGDSAISGSGGDGGLGGNGGTVTLDINNAITTSALLGRAIFATSRGGNGGDGGSGSGIVSGGGAGSGSGNGGSVSVGNTGTLRTFGSFAAGIFAQSIGGYSGDGGDSDGGVAFGGGATSGGDAGSVAIGNSGNITTSGTRSHAIFAQSVGGSGGDAGGANGVVALGGSGAGGGDSSTVSVINFGTLITTGTGARGIYAQSIGGGGGDGSSADGVVALGGSGSGGGSAGSVFVGNAGAITSRGDSIYAHSIGGGGGSGGSTGALVALGGAGSGGGSGGQVTVINTGALTATGGRARGIFAQSVGGGGGEGSFTGGLVSIGGKGSTASHGAAVSVTNSGTIDARSYAIYAQSLGGGGGDGGFSGGWFSFGGTAGAGGNASTVDVVNFGSLATALDDSSAIFAQSLGGGGGTGGGSVALGAFISVGLGASGGAGGSADKVDVTSAAPSIVTLGKRSYGVFAQSLGGGGGSGGFVASGSVGVGFSAAIGVGGAGNSGGIGNIVAASVGGDITTQGEDSAGIYAQSLGGGGGSGGWSITAAASDTAAFSLGFGGKGGSGGASSAVTVNTLGGHIETSGLRATGLFAQSLGGGGGNGGFSIAASGSGAIAGTLSLGGGGSGGGASGAVSVTSLHSITTHGAEANAIFAQSNGGGGGNGGFSIGAAGSGTAAGTLNIGGTGAGGGSAQSVTVLSQGALETWGADAVGLFAQSLGGGGGNGGFSIAGSGAGTGALTLAVGGFSGGGGSASFVDVENLAPITTRGSKAYAIFAQSLGGGGGNGGFNISGAGAGTAGISLSMGGSGGAGGGAGEVFVINWSALTTSGDDAAGLYAQSLGGGGGSGGFNISGSGGGTGAFTLGVGGSGDSGGIASRVDVTNRGAIETFGLNATGLFAQSLGGGGGQGRFNISGSGAGTGAGSLAFGGSGGGGGDAGSVFVLNQASITTHQNEAVGLFAQSLGGGGGNGGFNISGSGAGTGSGSIGVGGSGDGGGLGGAVEVTNQGLITTSGAASTGLFAQSTGGGGGSGRFSITGSGAGTGSGTLGIGGSGDGGGNAGTVRVTSEGGIITSGDDAIGLFAQSIGGGGGNGGFSIAGSGAGTGSGTVDIGGSGAGGGNGAAVNVAHTGVISTLGAGSTGLFAQSLGGGGGFGRFSIAGSGAKSGSGTFSLGGSGGGGGTGSTVNVNSAGLITTTGELAYGILAQSTGGGGGAGGFSFGAGLATTGGQFNSSLGGFGGTAGNADTVTVTNAAQVITTGAGAHAIYAESVGGGGGTGGFSGVLGVSTGAKPNVGFSIGGVGATAGNGALVTLDNLNSTFVSTAGAAAYGLFAQSVGGGGGDAGGSLVIEFGKHDGGTNLGLSFGGPGGAAGNGGAVDLKNGAAILTVGERSDAIVAQSLSEGGGMGGFSATGVIARGSNTKDLSVSVGGVGGIGGSAGTVTIENFGSITARGGGSRGIFAQSVGGSGGDGGFSFSGTFAGAAAKEGSIAVGGFGGEGGAGGTVQVQNFGAIDLRPAVTLESVQALFAAQPTPPTELEREEMIARLYTGKPAAGIVAQSVGGGGGNGGHSLAIGLGAIGKKEITGKPGPWTLNTSITVGGFGGAGNAGGLVTVDNFGSVITGEDDADAIFAQSIGGGGGRGGSANSAVISTGVVNEGQAFNTNLSLGGFGGDGNVGGIVDVRNGGTIFTSGDISNGIRAQSIGGGGGVAGSARGVNLMLGATFQKGEEPGDSWKLAAEVGGWGGDGNDGGGVTVSNSATITTTGALSRGIFAQSIGGGGGSGGDGMDGTGVDQVDLAFTVLEFVGNFTSQYRESVKSKGKGFLEDQLREWSFTVGGNQGAKGDASVVNISNSGNIFTSGYGSAAILAQSVGGGGGEATGYSQVVDAGGTSEAGAMGKFGIGGAGGSGGNGGLVSVINSGLLSTMGENAHGIFAQSVGGGGGMAGKVERMLPEEKQVLGFTIPALNIGLGLDYGRAGGSGGDGGEVDVFSTGDIITRGTAAYGIFAQSVGGGGGLAGGVGKISELLSEIGPINFAGSVGGSGSAGNVTVRQTGTIQTEGVGADGIFAQSAGGQGSGGIVDLRVIGNIFAMGEASRGILAQSRGDAGAGNIEIELLGGGTILGGLDGVADKDTVIRGIGVNIVEGAANTLTNFSTITTMSGIAGLAVQSTTGDETIRNSGTLIGSIELGAGTNRLLNRDSGRVFAGSTIDLGAGNLFTNAGLLSIGDAGDVRTTTLTGDFEIENAPRLLVDLGEIGVSDVFDIRGRQIANGVNRFDLNMLTTPAGNGAYTVMTASGGGISRDALGFGTLFGAMPLGRTFDVAATPDAASITLQPSAGTFVWSGGASEFWNSPFVDGISNWTRGGAGNSFVYGTPGAATDVVFATADGTSALGADFSINSLTFAGAGSASRGDTVGIAAGNLLTILSSAGITMQAGAAHATIATDVVIGTDQQWTNDGGGVLAIVGDSIRGVNRTLTVGGSGATFIGAAIDTGAGALVKEGSGTLQLAGDNSYSGGTFVRGGVLIGDATSLAGAIVNDAVVMFDQTTTGTYAGVMSGGGTFVKDGAGTLRLTGANTYRGGTAIFGGTLIGDTGSLQGDILDDAELAFDQADHGTYAGRLFGSGALAKTGAGTLTLSGLSGGFSGAIDVLAGSLVVDGFAGTGSLLMRRGTILGGTGFLPTTTVQDGATLSPGHSIGTITVVGDLTLAAGSSLRIEIDAAGTSDVVLATGSILLAGGSLDLRHLGAAEYLPITRYGFLAAEDGIEGAFGAVTTDLSFLEPSVQYGESEIYLTLRRTDVDFSRPGIDGSGGRVASALNALVMRADGEMASLVNTLFALPTADLAISLRSMSGAHYQHVATASLDDAERFMGVNFTRLGQPLAAAAGEGGTENAVSTIAGGMQASDVAPTGWWLRGLGGTTRQAGNGIDPAARVPSTGLAIGVDTRLGRRVTFGVSGARTTPRVVSDDLGDETHTRVWHLGAYGRYRQGASRVDVGVAGSSQEYRSERQVLAGATRATARADYDGDGLSARAEYGHAIAAGRTITLEPVAGLRYETLSFDGATETGADPIGLVLPARDVSSLRTTLGGRIEKRLGSAASAIWRLEGRAAWSHDFDARPDIRMTLVGDPDAAFSVAPMNQGRDTGLFGATIYGDAGASFRLFGDVSFETGGPVKGVSASLGFGRRW